MQNVQNAAEIQQRVINLVELYRTKVGKESDTAKKAKAEQDFFQKETEDFIKEMVDDGEDFCTGFGINADVPEKWIRGLQVNEQLLGYFYKEAAGHNAEKDVLDQLLPDVYDKTIFTVEEESFLLSHFKEMVDYIIQSPCDDLDVVNRHDEKDAFLLPKEVLELIGEHVQLSERSTIYNPFTGFAQFASLYNRCRFLCEETYTEYERKEDRKESRWLLAWMKVAIFANNIRAEIICDSSIPSSFDAAISFIPYLPKCKKVVKVDKGDYTYEDIVEEGYAPSILLKIQDMYDNLRVGGKLVIVTKADYFWSKEGVSPLLSFWESLISEHAIEEIIQLPDVMAHNDPFRAYRYAVIIAEKGRSESTATLIDAAFEYMANDSETTFLSLDALHSMMHNSGKDPVSGLRKMVMIENSELIPELLLPHTYTIERPFDEEQPVPLSSLCTFVKTRVRDIEFDLSEDTPVVNSSNVSSIYRGPLDIFSIEKAGCPNNPRYIKGSKDYAFNESGKLIESYFAQVRTSKGVQVLRYRESLYLDGKDDVVLFHTYPWDDIDVALLPAKGQPFVVGDNILALIPKGGIDMLSLVALLRLPIVIRQLGAYQEYGIGKHLDEILVPTDKRIIGDELYRMKKEENVYNELRDKFQTMKTEYINEVRMRKHDMGQYIFELTNIEDLIRYYIENRETEKDFCQEIETLLDNFRSSLSELSTLLDNLSKEEKFGEPELLNLNEFLSQLSNRHKADGFVVEIDYDKLSIVRYCITKYMAELSYKTIGEDKSIEGLDGTLRVDAIDESRSIENFGEDKSIEGLDETMCVDTIDESRSIENFGEDKSIEGLDETMCVDTIDESRSIENFGEDKSIERFDETKCVESTDDNHSIEDINLILDKEHLVNKNEGIPSTTYCIPPLFVARNDFQRMVNNIIDNAKKHGFTDQNRKDYKIKVVLSIDVKKKRFQIDFRNNGNPMPEGMNKMRYGIKGEKAGKTGGTGIGGNYVKQFVEHYGGDYDIFMEDGWTVIRIYLPIK